MSVFKACDIRGIVGDELNEDLYQRLGRSLGNMIQRRGGGIVCLGGDYRRSTPSYKRALMVGLAESSVRAIDIGQMPTPVIYFIARRMGCGNVAIITASHNSGRYNGLKLMIDSRPAVPDLMDELQRGLDEEPEVPGGMRSRDLTPRLRDCDMLSAYEAAVRAGATELVGGMCRRGMIVVDAMGGAMSGLAAHILRDEGFDVVAINDDIDPEFTTGPPNPAIDRHLDQLAQRVLVENADLGLAFDGDGDRVAVVDDSGKVVRPEQIGALLVQHVFTKPTVIYDQKCASILAAAVHAAEGRGIMQPSGHGFIKTTMIDTHADFGVEVSGHYFFNVLCGGDDGLFAGLVVARLVATSGKSLADLVAPIGWPAITPDLRIPVDGSPEAILERLAAQCGGQVSRMDGVRAEYEDGWALARASITEPVMTFRFEGKDNDRQREIIKRFLAEMPELSRQVSAALQ